MSLLALAMVARGEEPTDYSGALRWRNIGPHRGGRTRAVCGVPAKPNVFYMAPVNGGLFKSDDFGRTWTPIFDDQPTGSVGALAVSISNPEVIYVGSGEGLHRPDLSVGDGIYKSIDGGRSWSHLGLRDGQQIAQIAIDPRNADHLFVAVAGHPYGPNVERGIFRSFDGGKSFEKVLYKDENIGASDVQIDPKNPDTIYAALWESREGPWENSSWSGPGGGIYKSTDSGKTWQRLEQGLPSDVVQANIAVAPSSPNIVIAAVRTLTESKLYRSEDAGGTWNIATEDHRPGAGIGGGDLPVVRIDPIDPKVVYSASVVCWKSTDGGRNWEGWRGAPGGDDYQNVWINPNDSQIILLGSDQGAIVTVNGGRSWSSWYNQSTAQLYHVSADNAFPYRLYSGQQESGSVGIASRGVDGAITFRDWHPVSAEEYGYVVADPLDPDIVFGGKLTRFDRRTGQAQDILPLPLHPPEFRLLRTQPLLFSPLDPHLLYFAGSTLWKTRDRGETWEQISPDLTRKTYELPESIGKYRSDPSADKKQRGVIYTIAPSPLDSNRIWAGTDDGLVHVTSDGGKTWSDVTPAQISAWQKISVIDASHFDANTAYAAVNTLRVDDNRPHIYRTSDAGKSWTEIIHGIADGQTVNVVRADPQRRGLLFAGTERSVYVSLDDGANWQSLRLNMPASSIRDLIVKDDDLAVATHGRGFWILDNMTPLRQSQAAHGTTLLKPQVALRVRWNLNTDTPLPPDEPVGENPPDGAMLDYQLEGDAAGAVTLEIKDGQGESLRRFSSDDAPAAIDPKEIGIPPYWVRPPQRLSGKRGLHRFLWDLHYAPLAGIAPEFPIAAIYRNTAPQPTSPWAIPGEYSVTLTVGGKAFTQPLTVKMDPRVKTSPADLREQFELAQRLYAIRPALEKIGNALQPLSESIQKTRAVAGQKPVAAKLDQLAQKVMQFTPPNPRRGSPISLDLLSKVQRTFDTLQEVDGAPRPSVKAAVAQLEQSTPAVIERWRKLIAEDLVTTNRELKASGIAEIQVKE